MNTANTTTFQYNGVSFTGQAPEDHLWILCKSDDLSNTLGVTDAICGTVESQRQKGFAALGTYPVDLQGGRHTMFIHCDFVQNEILGDFQAALLRVIPLQHNVASTAATCYRTFDKMQWKRLHKSNFHSITISLCDESGQLMPSVSIGRTNITLSFQRRKKTVIRLQSTFMSSCAGPVQLSSSSSPSATSSSSSWIRTTHLRWPLVV